MTENDKQLYQLTQGVTRIANYMHEILLLVKKDQENMQRYKEKTTEKWDQQPDEGDMRDHFTKAVISEQTTRASNGPRIPAALAMAQGSRSKLQATSGKLQASSCKLDKTKL